MPKAMMLATNVRTIKGRWTILRGGLFSMCCCWEKQLRQDQPSPSCACSPDETFFSHDYELI